MSKYTTTIYQIINSGYDLGMNDYPIFDSNYRRILNNKILNHFMFREIGFETVEMFKFYLNRTLNEIMPYYNELYKTTVLNYNPLTNYKMHDNIDFNELINELRNSNTADNTFNYIQDIIKANADSTFHSDTSTNDSGKTVNNTTENNTRNYTDDTTTNDTNTSEHTNDTRKSDTPQGMITKGFMSDETWISYAEQNKDNTKSTDKNTRNNSGTNTDSNIHDSTTSVTNNSTGINDSKDSSTTNDNSKNLSENSHNTVNLMDNDTNRKNNTIRDSEGYQGVSPMDLIKKMRDNIINIDMLIIADLNDLFMLIY